MSIKIFVSPARSALYTVKAARYQNDKYSFHVLVSMANWQADIYKSLEELKTAIEATVNTSSIELVADPLTERFLLAKTA